MEEQNSRYFNLLQTTLEQMDARIIAYAETDAKAREALGASVLGLQRELMAVKEQVIGLRVRLGVVWGVASVAGGAVVVGAVKLLGLA